MADLSSEIEPPAAPDPESLAETTAPWVDEDQWYLRFRRFQEAIAWHQSLAAQRLALLRLERDEAAALRRRCQELEARLHSIETSSFWRMTRPARSALQRMPMTRHVARAIARPLVRIGRKLRQ